MRRYLPSFSAALVAGLLVVGVASPVVADVEAYRGTASAAGASVDVLGIVTLDLGASEASVSDGTAAATATGLSALEATTSTAASDNGTGVADPADGQNCAVPSLPAPLDGLTPDVVCSKAAAVGGSLPSATSSATTLSIALPGSVLADLVDFLVDAALADLTAALDGALEPLEDTTGALLEPVISGLSEQCGEGIAELTEVSGDVVDEALNALEGTPLGEVIDPAIGALGDALEQTTEVLPPACAELVQLLADLPSVNALVEDVAAALRDALGDLTLIDLELGGSSSASTVTATDVVTTSSSLGASLELPAIGDLTDLLDGLLSDVIGTVVGALAESLEDQFDDLVPTVEVLIQPVLDAVQLPDLLGGTDPLLSLTVGPSATTTTLDRADGTVVTEGTGSVVSVTLSSVFATLLGEENTTFAIGVGESQTLFEETPLESSIALTAPAPVEREIDGIAANGTSIAAAQLNLFTGVEGGIALGLTPAESLTGGTSTSTPAPSPTPAPELPRTGGGAALLAIPLLGLGLWARRRDS